MIYKLGVSNCIVTVSVISKDIFHDILNFHLIFIQNVHECFSDLIGFEELVVILIKMNQSIPNFFSDFKC